MITTTTAPWVHQVLREAEQSLADAGIPGARREAETLLAGVLGCTPLEVYVTRALTRDQARTFAAWMTARLRGTPTAYVTGRVRFGELEFIVTPATLIPRPETELVLAAAVAHAQELSRVMGRLRLVDVGTGCGNLAISLTSSVPSSTMVAVDRSFAALNIARLNAARLGVAERVVVLQGDGLQPIACSYAPHMVVANPPYIPSCELAQLPREVQQEPRLALDGGPDGCAWTTLWLRQAAERLAPGGVAIVELGAGQAEQVRAIVADTDGLRVVEIQRDWNEIPRVLIAQRIV